MQDEAAQQPSIVQPILVSRLQQAHESDINAVEFCPTGQADKLATVSDDGALKIWKISTPTAPGPSAAADTEMN